MSAILSLTEVQTLTTLRSFLLSVLPSGVEVVRGQDNRVPEPAGTNYVMMTPLMRERLETNVDAYSDVAFTGSIAAATLTVTAVSLGAIAVGAQLLGNNLAANTVVTALGTGTGGIGTYTVSPSQTVASQIMAAGTQALLQPTKVTVQLDVHGPASADNVQIITTLFRDEYAVDQFTTSNFDVTPLYAGEPHQIPFLNAEQQIEERWTVDVVMQANPIITVPQQFASQLEAILTDVQAQYPAN
jgi:hypothetical protein